MFFNFHGPPLFSFWIEIGLLQIIENFLNSSLTVNYVRELILKFIKDRR